MTLAARAPVLVFLAFAFAYFFAALLRAVTATLAPVFSAELGLTASDLGLLAGAFFFGFAASQLPLGRALDRIGPRATLLGMLSLAVLGCAAFALADGLPGLVAARALIGAGLGACLMAALTQFRHSLSAALQRRANAWMLMTGSLGMVVSTVPVQALLPVVGWRGLFWIVGACIVLAMLGVAWLVPRQAGAGALPASGLSAGAGYRAIARHPLFVSMAPLGFFGYGGLIAMQTLWVGPWLTRVCGWTASEAARGLFLVNLSMLFTFMAWGWAMPRLLRHANADRRLISWGMPLAVLLLLANVALGPQAGALHWAAWCVLTSVITLTQPAVGAAFPAGHAGRALSAFNLVIFSGVFCVQWGIGLLIDGLRAFGMQEMLAFRWAFVAFALCVAASYLWFVRTPGPHPHNPP